ncbi:MAG: hypothetical protein OXC48_09580 [Endozoicomonadaceae bacterium]|nr:hypothetical protein [Endozoicomonadaceae bacterium]
MNITSGTKDLHEQGSTALKNRDNKKIMNEHQQVTPQPAVPCKTLYESVTNALEDYFSYLDGEPPANLYEMVIAQVECALLNFVMERTNHNKTRTAKSLGISRGTLIKKIAQHKIDSSKRGE